MKSYHPSLQLLHAEMKTAKASHRPTKKFLYKKMKMKLNISGLSNFKSPRGRILPQVPARRNVFTELLPRNDKGIHRQTRRHTRLTILLLLRGLMGGIYEVCP
jgi:hypothetical protein